MRETKNTKAQSLQNRFFQIIRYIELIQQPTD